MGHRLPPEAFDHYVGLGADRSYQAVADYFGVAKRTVTRTAAQEDWPERLEQVQRCAREQGDRALEEGLAAVRSRHLKGLRALFARAVEGLRNHPYRSAAEAARGLETAIKLERLARGFEEPGELMTVEERARQLREQIHAANATVPGPPDGMDEGERATA